MTTITLTTTQAVETCCNCGIVFSMPSDYQQRRRNDHKNFFCPAGHPQHYFGKSEAEQLRDQLAARDEALRDKELELDQARTRVRGLKIKVGKAEAVAKRIEIRVHAGVCPCCNRTFKALARHMKTQHSDDPRAAVELEKLAAGKTA